LHRRQQVHLQPEETQKILIPKEVLTIKHMSLPQQDRPILFSPLAVKLSIWLLQAVVAVVALLKVAAVVLVDF
jgi:hypothetical protein